MSEMTKPEHDHGRHSGSLARAVGAEHASTPGHAELRDPVCGMTVAADTPHRSMHAGQTVRFCSAGCKAKFDANPAQYAK